MLKFFGIAATVAVLMIAPSPACAEATANEFIQKIDAGETSYMYLLDAYQNGISWADVAMGQETGKKLYCAPAKLGMTPEGTLRILRDSIKEKPTIGGAPAGLAVLLALQNTFPC